MAFRLAHLSDPHCGPLPAPRLSELAGKRLTGYLNWRQSRRDIHNMDMLTRIIDDILAHEPDHVALTGDLVNIGLAAEFPLARRHLARLGGPDQVSVVPGNHDAYVRGSLAAMDREFSAFQSSDEGAPGFPYLRLRGEIALIGVSSAVPTLPFVAGGTVGARQRAALAALLAECRRKKLATVAMIHHPPHRGGAKFARGLTDAAAFERVLAANGCDLVLHGHNHRNELKRLAGPEGPVWIAGVASASAVPGSPHHRAAWRLFSIENREGRAAIVMETRGVDQSGGPIRTLAKETLG